MPKLKAIAVIDKGYSTWSALCEIDRETIGKLMGVYPDSTAPKSGDEFDLTKIFDRLENLESRERKLREWQKLLAEITNPQIPIEE